MSTSLALSLCTIVVAVLSFVISDYTRRVYRRRVKELEKELAARRLGEELRRAFVARLAAQGRSRPRRTDPGERDQVRRPGVLAPRRHV